MSQSHLALDRELVVDRFVVYADLGAVSRDPLLVVYTTPGVAEGVKTAMVRSVINRLQVYRVTLRLREVVLGHVRTRQRIHLDLW